MHFALADGDRQEFRDAFAPPFLWSRLVGTEAMRGWRVLEESPLVTLMHGTGAVALLRRDGDRVLDVTLLEGPPAEAVVRRLGFPATADLRRRVTKAFRIGASVDAAIAAAFRQPVAEVRLGEGLRGFRSPEGALVEVRVASGRVVAVRLHTGGDALDLLRAAATAARWAVPVAEGDPVRARDLADARAHLDRARGTWLEHHVEGEVVAVLAHLPEGRRVLRFVLAEAAT